MDLFWCIFYFIGVIFCFMYLNAIYKNYIKEHPDAESDRDTKKYNDSMMIVMSMFSWLGLIVLIAGRLCNNGDYDDDIQS